MGGILLASGAAQGQRVTGPWEDAAIAPRGVLRVAVSPSFAQWKDRFRRGDGTREPLGADLTFDSLGTARLPFVATLRPDLSLLTGVPDPALSLGSLATHLEVTEVTTTVAIDYGLTNRIGLLAIVPYVKNHVYVTPIPDGTRGTLGLNPAFTFAGARTQNEAVVTSLGTAAATLTAELARCLGLTDATCSAINADRPGATALVQLAATVSDALANVYGTPNTTGNVYSPMAGSALQAAVEARLAAMNTQFRSFLGGPLSGEWVNGRPVGAPPLGAADLASVLGDPSFGIAARPLGDFEHSHVGDIEVGAKVELLDTFGPAAASSGGLRLSVAGIARLATGQRDLPDDFTDRGAGDQQADLEFRALADIGLGRRFWTSAVVRLGIQRADRLAQRITDAPGDPFPEIARRQEVERDLGDVLEFELAPRFVPNDEMSISGIYRHRRKGSDTYRGTFDVTSADGTPLALDAATLGLGTEQVEQLAGFAITYSTVRGNARRQARWPLEISYIHTIVLGGEGVPRAQANAIALRISR